MYMDQKGGIVSCPSSINEYSVTMSINSSIRTLVNSDCTSKDAMTLVLVCTVDRLSMKSKVSFSAKFPSLHPIGSNTSDRKCNNLQNGGFIIDKTGLIGAWILFCVILFIIHSSKQFSYLFRLRCLLVDCLVTM